MKNYCVDCNKLLLNRSSLNPPKRCWKCRVKYLGDNADGGETGKIHYCKKCDNEISYNSWKYGMGLCRPCAGKFRGGKNHHSYGRPSKLPNCVDCDKQLIDYRSKRCPNCSSIKFLGKRLKQNLKSPNKPEKFLNKLLNVLFPKEYKFVGNGKVIIGEFCPDFINCNGQKKIIELYGDYWHRTPKFGKRNKRRLQTYIKYGYKTLIVWEHELKDLVTLNTKIINFNK